MIRSNVAVISVVMALGLVTTFPRDVSATAKPAPSDVRVVPVASHPEALPELGTLLDAKARGDAVAIRDAHRDLGWGAPYSGAEARRRPVPMTVRSSRLVEPDPLSDEVLISDLARSSAGPAIASRSDGTLFAAVEDLGSTFLDVYRSDDDGHGWTYMFSLTGAEDIHNPSVAVGEGNVNRLLIAYEEGSGTPEAGIRLFWWDLDTEVPGFAMVQAQPYGTLGRPRVCVDSPEYNYWYPYLTWTRGVIGANDQTNVMFSRSLDYGATWETPQTLAADVTLGAYPDIDFGGDKLYVTYPRFGSGADRDVYYRRSTSLGAAWDPEVGLAITTSDEFEPRVAATNGGDAAVVAFTKEYSSTDTDIESYTTTNGGGTWVLAYLPWDSSLEGSVDLDVSDSYGRVHAIYRRGSDIQYSWSDHVTPNVWALERRMNDVTLSDPYYPPCIVTDPAKPQEAGAAWTVQAPDESRVYYAAAYPLGQYLMVAGSNAIGSALGAFTTWKEQIGYDVRVVTLDEIYETHPDGDDAERIWSYLSDRRSDLRYVLLVGDVDLIPMRALYPDGNPAYPPNDPKHDNGGAYGSDHYYAKLGVVGWDLDGDDRWGEFTDDALDPVPSVLVGRIPFSDAATVQSTCANIVSFEQASGAWKRDVLLAHGFLNYSGKPGDAVTDAAYAGEAIRNDYLGPQGWSSYRLYEKGGLGPSSFPSEGGLSQTTYRARVGWGRHGVVSCMAHGNTGGMAGIRWLTDLNANGLTDLKEEWTYNGFSLWQQVASHPASGAVFLNGCSTGIIWGKDPAFEASGLNSRYLIRVTRENTMLKEYLRHGAAGVMASTAGSDYHIGWTSAPGWHSQALGYFFFEELAGGLKRVGDAFHRAAVTYAQTRALQRGIRVFNYYGDPSLTLEDVSVPGAMARDDLASLTPMPASRLTGPVSGSRPARAESRDTGRRVDRSGGPLPAVWVEMGDLEGCTSASAILRTGPILLAGGMASVDSTHNQGVVYRSPDEGQGWERVDIAGCWSVRALHRRSSGTLLAGGLAEAEGVISGAAYRSTDNGLTWPRTLSFPSGIVTDFAELEGAVYAAAGWNGGIYRSIDDGVSWELVTELGPGMQINSLGSTSETLLAGLENPEGLAPILGSTDGAAWWPAGGLDVVESAYEIIDASGILYAGVRELNEGGWVYQSDDGGASWSRTTEFTDPTNVQAIRSLALGSDGSVFAGASSGPGPAQTKVFVLPPESPVWEEFGGMVDLANEVHDIEIMGASIFVSTGDIYGNVYACSLGDVVEAPTDGEGPEGRLRLDGNSPNPFNPRTTIRYELPQPMRVTLRVFDASGHLVRELVRNEVHSAGFHGVVWDGTDGFGRDLASGVYYYRLAADGLELQGDMVLIR